MLFMLFVGCSSMGVGQGMYRLIGRSNAFLLMGKNE